jgi:RNA polymerase sigma-B factor
MPTNSANQSTQITKLLRAYHGAQSPDAKEKIKARLLELNSDLVKRVLASSGNQESNDNDDFFQVGLQGLAHSIEHFNLDGKQEFKLFATPYIHQFIQNYAGQIVEQALNESAINAKSPTSYSQIKPKSSYKNFNKDLSDDTPPGIIKAETLEVFELYKQESTQYLRDRLVRLNIGLVKKEANHWSNQCTESYDDLMQVGSMGLLRAIDRFDLEKGYAFSTFAVPYIRGEIQHYLRDKSPTLKIPRQWLTIYNQGCKVIRQLQPKLKRDPSDLEIAEVLGIPVTDWLEIKLACKNRSPLSLDAPVNNEENDGCTSLGELVQDHKYRSFQLAQEDSIRIQQALSHLEDRTREVVEFVFLKEFTHREVAEILGISAITVSRQVKKGLAILKEVLTAPIDKPD